MMQRLTVPAQYNQLARITAFVLQAAQQVGFDETQRNRIELAVDEACTNIIEHAYAGTALTGKITVEVEGTLARHIKIILTDTGKSFEPDKLPAYVPCSTQTALDSLKVGGLGLHLIRQTMDAVCFEFNVPTTIGAIGVFNRLTMLKNLKD